MRKPKVNLVKGWRTWWRQWSTWLVATSISLLMYTPELVEAINYAWQYIPMDIKNTFSEEVVRWVGYIIGILSIPAKLVRQPSLKQRADAEGED